MESGTPNSRTGGPPPPGQTPSMGLVKPDSFFCLVSQCRDYLPT